MTLPEPERKRRVVETMFDRIANDYDRMNRLMTLGLDLSWRRRTVREVGLRSGELVVDVGCGTGDFVELFDRAGAFAIGVDVSAGMLGVGRRRLPDASFVRADGLALPFADGAVDHVVSGFALRNVVDPEAFFREAARVLRPGGRVAVLEVDEPRSAVLRWGHALWFRGVVPRLGALLSDREAYAYLPQSTAYMPASERLARMIRGAGFGEPRKISFLGGAAQLVVAEAGGRA